MPKFTLLRPVCSAALSAALLIAAHHATAADNTKYIPQEGYGGPERYPDWDERGGVLITNQDWPGTVNKYYGQRRDQSEDTQRRIAKVDLDADLNYDGVITNDDPADSGAFERTPPGLIVGVGELAKVVVRVTPYRVDFRGQAVVALEITGINRGNRTGEFKSFEEEVANTSRLRVWSDPDRQHLLLDSHDKNKRRVEWSIDNHRLSLGGAITGMNLPFQSYPRRVYVEGVKPHGKFIGDVRLLLVCEHRDIKPGEASTPKGLERFRAAWETMLFTVTPEPQPKEYVISESLQDVWFRPGRTVSPTK